MKKPNDKIKNPMLNVINSFVGNMTRVCESFRFSLVFLKFEPPRLLAFQEILLAKSLLNTDVSGFISFFSLNRLVKNDFTY